MIIDYYYTICYYTSIIKLKEKTMWAEQSIRNRKIFLEKLGHDTSWIIEGISVEELDQKIKKLLKKKPTETPRTYKELSYPVSIGGYGLSQTFLQVLINRERKRYGR